MLLTNSSQFNIPDLQGRKILVFGKDGQLGISLQKLFLHLKIPVVFLGREQCDLSQEQSILQNLKQYQPQIILNAAETFSFVAPPPTSKKFAGSEP